MKKLAIIVLFVLLAGCATAPYSKCFQDESFQRQVASAINKLCYSNDIDPYKVYLCVVADDKINASIDGKPIIYVTTGLLYKIPNDDYLACIIAHELSHYTLKHLEKSQAISLATSAIFIVGDFFLPGVGYANYLANPAITNTYGRANELEADENAVKMLENSGMYHARTTFIEMLRWLESAAGKRDPTFFLWATHPSVDDRIKNLSE